jgi:hypothetical protein
MPLTHEVTIRGEVQVQACERRWNNFCWSCEEAEDAVPNAREVQFGLLGGCVESVQVECVFGRELDGSVVFEQWSVWVTPNEEANPWCQDAGGYDDAARIARVLGAQGRADLVVEGPFTVLYYELGSGAERSSAAPAGLAFETRHGTALEYPTA